MGKKRLHVEHIQRVLKFALSCRWMKRLTLVIGRNVLWLNICCATRRHHATIFTTFWKLFMSKVVGTVSNRWQMLRQKCTKFTFGYGSSWGEFTAPPDTVAGFKGPSSIGRERRGRGKRVWHSIGPRAGPPFFVDLHRWLLSPYNWHTGFCKVSPISVPVLMSFLSKTPAQKSFCVRSARWTGCETAVWMSVARKYRL